MQKFFSIIVPLYNPNLDHLSRTIGSIINQTIIDQCEIIFIDDNSSSKDYEKILKHTIPLTKKYKLIVLDENLGPGLSRQRGLDEATGEWVTFVDQDDALFDSTVLELVKERLISSGATLMMNTLCRIADRYDYEKTGVYIDEFHGDYLHGKFLNREALKEWELSFSPDIRTHEDTYLCGKLSVIEFHEQTLKQDYRICVNEPDMLTYIWYLWNDSASHRIQEGGLEYFEKEFDTFCIANEAAIEYALERYNNPLFYVPRGINAICTMYWHTQQHEFIHKDDGIKTKIREESYKFIKWVMDKLGWSKDYIKEMVYGDLMNMYFETHTDVAKTHQPFIAMESFEDFLERMV